MKVRHKQTDEEFTLDQSTWPDRHDDETAVVDKNGECRLFKAKYLEPVPTETWRDVTDKTIIQDDGWLTFSLAPIAKISDGYRLRKVQCPMTYDFNYAFIIEKREV